MAIPSLKMNNGKKIPQVGLGLWQMYLGPSCKNAVKEALKAGYRHFDTAQAYLNEQHLGAAIEASDIDRKDVFITTKIWNRNQPEDKLIPSFEKSLKKLRTDYVDLLLLHFPVSETRRQAWPLMEEIHKSGRAKAIGVSNYMVSHLEELLADCRVRPAVNQIELHVFLQQPELVKYCQKQGIVVEAYSPLVRGRNMDDPVLMKIAEKHGKTTAQIMLRWCIEIGSVPLPKSTHKERIQQNIDIFDFKLDTGDMKQIAKLDEDYRTNWDPTNVE